MCVVGVQNRAEHTSLRGLGAESETPGRVMACDVESETLTACGLPVRNFRIHLCRKISSPRSVGLDGSVVLNAELKLINRILTFSLLLITC